MLKRILLHQNSIELFIQVLYDARLRAVVFKRKVRHDKVIRDGELVVTHLRSHTEIHLEELGINTQIFSQYRQPKIKYLPPES